MNYPYFWEHYEKLFKGSEHKDLSLTRFVVIDTETTGLDLKTDRILCIGALSIQNGTIAIKNSFEVYLDQYFYHAKNIEIHGILKKDSIEQITELEAIQSLLTYIGNSILVGHHVGFDILMVNEALKRHGLPNLKNKSLDTSQLYIRTLIKSNLLESKNRYSLDELAEKFDISKKDRHTALGDAYITAIAFLKILSKLRKKKEFSLKWLLTNPQWPFK